MVFTLLFRWTSHDHPTVCECCVWVLCSQNTGLLVVPIVSSRGQSLQLSGHSSLQPELWVTVRFIFFVPKRVLRSKDRDSGCAAFKALWGNKVCDFRINDHNGTYSGFKLTQFKFHNQSSQAGYCLTDCYTKIDLHFSHADLSLLCYTAL